MILQSKKVLIITNCFLLGYLFQVLKLPTASAQLMSEYTQKIGKLSSLESKVQLGREAVKLSLTNLQKTKDEKTQKEIFNETAKQHAELKTAIREYNAIRDEIKYKFPKKHDQTVRRYMPIREESLDEIENEMGLDGILSRVKAKIDKKYEAFKPKEKEMVSPTEPESRKAQKKDEEKESPRLRLER